MKIASYNVNGVIVATVYLPNGNPRPGPKFDFKLRWFEQLTAPATTRRCGSSSPAIVLPGARHEKGGPA